MTGKYAISRMSDKAQAMARQDVHEASYRWKSAVHEEEHKRIARDRAILRAHALGVKVVELMELTDLSKPRIHQIVGERRKADG